MHRESNKCDVLFENVISYHDSYVYRINVK